MKGSSTSIRAFLHVHMSGISIRPVSLNIGNTELMSSLSCGVKVIVIVVDKPADILPVGVYWMWKKSLILSSRGSNLNELKENETFVKRIVCVWATPTVKSYTVKSVKIKDISASCTNQKVDVYVQTFVTYLENYFVWF